MNIQKFAFTDLAKANLLNREVTSSYHRRTLVRIAAEKMKTSSSAIENCVAALFTAGYLNNMSSKKGKTPSGNSWCDKLFNIYVESHLQIITIP